MTSRDEIIQRFESEGISIKEWAEAKGYKPRLVYAVIQGTVQCKRGASHQIAVDLGMKPAPTHSLLGA